MLLPINKPICADDLCRATCLACKVLDYAANCPDAPFDENDFCEKLERGRWLMRKRTTVGLAITSLFTLSKTERNELHEAFRHDVSFCDHIGDPDWQFKFPRLKDSIREVGGKLLVSFYEDILADAGFKGLAKQVIKSMNSASFEQSYRKANDRMARICPACLGELPDRIEERSLDDREHFFPKSTYAPLAVHPVNLVLICMPCNQRVHMDALPLNADNGETLLDTFVPYIRPGLDEIALDFGQGYPYPEIEVNSRILDAHALARAKNFNQLFHVTDRWKERVQDIHEDIVASILDRYPDPTENDISQELAHKARVSKLRLLESPTRAYLALQYAEWLHSKHFTVFVRHVKMRVRQTCGTE